MGYFVLRNAIVLWHMPHHYFLKTKQNKIKMGENIWLNTQDVVEHLDFFFKINLKTWQMIPRR